jgi:hypothetical protein
MAMVVRANRLSPPDGGDLGGHIASFASLAKQPRVAPSGRSLTGDLPMRFLAPGTTVGATVGATVGSVVCRRYRRLLLLLVLLHFHSAH